MVIVRDLFKYNASFRVGSIMLLIIFVMAALSFVAPYEPNERRVVPKNLPPSREYIMGTNSLGQDVFWRLTYAVRNSLLIAGLAVIIGIAHVRNSSVLAFFTYDIMLVIAAQIPRHEQDYSTRLLIYNRARIST